MKKKIVIIIAIILVIILGLLIRIVGRTKISKDKIISYVKDNYEIIDILPLEEIKELKYTPDNKSVLHKKEKEIIKKYFDRNTIVDGISAYSNDIFEFSCGATGFLDIGTYYGFYYSRNDIPSNLGFSSLIILKEIEPGIFEWHDEKGKSKQSKGHSFYTEKIKDNWWYYEMIYY